jgi:hypothetical protein
MFCLSKKHTYVKQWYFPGLGLVICSVVKDAILWDAVQLNFVDVTNAAPKRWYPSTKLHGVTTHKTAVYTQQLTVLMLL